MFIHNVFRENDEAKIVEFIREHPFAAVVSIDGGRPIATHIPIEITKNSAGHFVLEGHVLTSLKNSRTTIRAQLPKQ